MIIVFGSLSILFQIREKIVLQSMKYLMNYQIILINNKLTYFEVSTLADAYFLIFTTKMQKFSISIR